MYVCFAVWYMNCLENRLKFAGFTAKMLRTDEDLSHTNLGLNFKHVSNNLTASLGQTSTRFDKKHLSVFWLPLSPSNLETFPAGAKIQSYSRSHLMPLVHNVVYIYIYAAKATYIYIAIRIYNKYIHISISLPINVIKHVTWLKFLRLHFQPSEFQEFPIEKNALSSCAIMRALGVQRAWI